MRSAVLVVSLQQDHPVFPSSTHAAVPSVLGPSHGHIGVELGIKPFDQRDLLCLSWPFVSRNVQTAGPSWIRSPTSLRWATSARSPPIALCNLAKASRPFNFSCHSPPCPCNEDRRSRRFRIFMIITMYTCFHAISPFNALLMALYVSASHSGPVRRVRLDAAVRQLLPMVDIATSSAGLDCAFNPDSRRLLLTCRRRLAAHHVQRVH